MSVTLYIYVQDVYVMYKLWCVHTITVLEFLVRTCPEST